MPKVYTHSFATGMGTVRTAATDRGLALIALPGQSDRWFKKQVTTMFPTHEVATGGTINRQAEKELRSYLGGRLKRFSVSLDLQATPFQRQVLRRVAKIPYGRTMTYGEIAQAIGNPGAARAVGTANARNHLPLIVPCHRVVAGNGLGGYGGGLKMKTRLLTMEGSR